MIANPIIHKEVLSSLRTRKAVAMQAMFLLVMAALAWLYWPADGLQDVAGAESRQIFSILAIGELIMVAMFAPAFTAASITSEREHGTLESLFSTTLKPWEIVVGKMVGSLSFLVLLALTGALGLAMPLLLGGVSGGMVVGCLAVLVVTAIYLGMVGLAVSTIMRRSYRAIIVTYAALLVLVFLMALPAWPLGDASLIDRAPHWLRAVLHLLASLSPLQAIFSLVLPDLAYARGAIGMPPFWVCFLVEALAVIAAAAGYCLKRLAKPVAPPRPREKLRVVERNQLLTGRSVFYLFFFDPNRRKSNIRWWQNPVLVKEFRTRPMLQARWILRATSGALIGSVLLMMLLTITVMATVQESPNRIADLVAAIGALMAAMVVLVGPAMSSGAVCSDLESGVWDLMRATPLPSWRIVSGKFQASIIPLLLLVLAMVPALALLLFFEVNLWPRILQVLGVVVVAVLFVCTTGTMFSALLTRTSTSTAWTYAVVITLGLAALLVLLGASRFSSQVVGLVLIANPIAAALDAAGLSSVQAYNGSLPTLTVGQFSVSRLMWWNLLVLGGATVLMFLVTVVRVVQLRRADR